MFIAQQYGMDMHMDYYDLGYEGSVWFYDNLRDCMLAHWNL